MPSPVIAPTQTPVIAPQQVPWQETWTDPERLCPQQVQELGSPDIMP